MKIALIDFTGEPAWSYDHKKFRKIVSKCKKIPGVSVLDIQVKSPEELIALPTSIKEYLPDFIIIYCHGEMTKSAEGGIPKFKEVLQGKLSETFLKIMPGPVYNFLGLRSIKIETPALIDVLHDLFSGSEGVHKILLVCKGMNGVIVSELAMGEGKGLLFGSTKDVFVNEEGVPLILEFFKSLSPNYKNEAILSSEEIILKFEEAKQKIQRDYKTDLSGWRVISNLSDVSDEPDSPAQPGT